jgi:mono/diheme cytochrome c family protein
MTAQTRTEAKAGTVVKSAAPAAGHAERGGPLYVKFGCYQCHGREAQGASTGSRLGPNPRPYDEFAEYTRNPTDDMPPYTTKVLSDTDLRDIYAFVASRPKPAGRPALLERR